MKKLYTTLMVTALIIVGCHKKEDVGVIHMTIDPDVMSNNEKVDQSVSVDEGELPYTIQELGRSWTVEKEGVVVNGFNAFWKDSMILMIWNKDDFLRFVGDNFDIKLQPDNTDLTKSFLMIDGVDTVVLKCDHLESITLTVKHSLRSHEDWNRIKGEAVDVLLNYLKSETTTLN